MISTTSSFPVPTVPMLRGDAEDRETLARMITAEGARAVLLFGEIGAGRTTLLTRGVIPLLEEGGAQVFLPGAGAAFAQGFVKGSGETPQEGEPARELLVRAINARPGTLAVFVLDDVDLLLADANVTDELHKLFVRVTTMTRGQARFLFSCADVRLHTLDALERRAGTMFPANVRLRLPRLPAAAGVAALGQLCPGADAELLRRLVATVDNGAGVLPAELPLLARAVAELGLRSARDVVGRPDLRWIERAAQATGDRRAALRLLGELAEVPGALPAAVAAASADVPPDVAARALARMTAAGLCRQAEDGFALAHEILARRVRELAAAARREHADARATLAAAADRGHLGEAEWRALRREGISPSRPEEARVFARQTTLTRATIAALCVLPVAAVIIYFLLQRGSFHFAAEGDRLVVRSGRAFLPGGGRVADSGLTREMVTPAAWRDLGPVAGDERATRALAALRPTPRALRQYALTGDVAALEALRGELRGPDAWWVVLPQLAPIARGTPAEAALLEQALANPMTAPAAFALVARAGARREGAFADLLAKGLLGDDLATRRQAAAVVAALPPASRAAVIAEAAAQAKGAAQAAELLELLQAMTRERDLPVARVAAGAAALVALTPEPALRMLEALRARDPAAVAPVLAGLAGDARAAKLLLDHPPPSLPPEAVAPIAAAARAGVPPALPLLARVAPAEARTVLAGLGEAAVPVRLAMAQALGILAASDAAAATEGLDKLLDGAQPAPVRAAAARAYGKLGQAAQDRLSVIALAEGPPVGEAALDGLAESVLAGGGTGKPLDAIFKMWQRKGAAKRRATAAAAIMAARKPYQVVDYFASAVHDGQDSALHPIGAEGLCIAADAGSQKALNTLVTALAASDDPTRARIAACLAEHPALAARLAPRLVTNPDPSLRAALASPEAGGAVLRKLAADGDRGVRQAAVAALVALGDQAGVKLAGAWAAAAPDEQLGLVAAAEALRDKELVAAALHDPRPEVRRRALRAGIALELDVAEALAAALADPDASLRREVVALTRDAKTLEIAAHDADADVAERAARRLGEVGDPAALAERIAALLAERSEAARGRALQLARGLAERDAAAVVRLVTPLMNDPARDVRARALVVLAVARAQEPAAALAQALRAAEDDAPRRLVAAAALLERGRRDKAGAQAALSAVRGDGAPFARADAELALALLAADADGPAFLALLAP